MNLLSEHFVHINTDVLTLTLAVFAFWKALYSQALHLPTDVPNPGAKDQMPVNHVFVADEVFPLRRELMRPSPEQNNTNSTTSSSRAGELRTVNLAFMRLSGVPATEFWGCLPRLQRGW